MKLAHSLRVSLTHAAVARPLTLSASPMPPSLVLSLSQPHTHTLSLSHKSEHSHRVSLTNAAVARPLSLSTSPTPWSPSVSKNQKKKVSPFMQNAKCKVCFTVCMLRNSGKNGRIFCESFFFLFFCFFGFCFEFPIELLKKIEALLFFEFRLCF